MNRLEQAVKDFNERPMSDEAKRLILNNPSLNISGPTGAGKGTVSLYLTQTGNYTPVVSDTTRALRPYGNGYEVNGLHYWFIDEETALRKLSDDAFIEAKVVHQDTMYGTSIESYKRVVDSGRVPILEIDVQGMEDIINAAPGTDAILLLPPSFEVWEQRIDGRGDMNEAQKIKRFATAVFEYGKPIENRNFYPVINTEVVDTAEVIMSGEYRSDEYRENALSLAVELRDQTQAFLDAHQ